MSVYFNYRYITENGIENIRQKSKVYGERTIKLRGLARKQYKVYNVNRKAMEWVIAEGCEII